MMKMIISLNCLSIITISAKVVRKQERTALLETLDLIMQQKVNNEAPIIETTQKQNVEMDVMEKYDSTPPINRSIDRSYFLKSYRYGFIIFAISFILFYLLIRSEEHTSELQSRGHLVCRLLLEKKN